jgi:DNA polymerase-4
MQVMHMPDRTILHCDCDSFFASVEETFHPEYRQVPMAVAGDPESRRGIILAKNQLAKGFGVKTAETIWAAKQKCPGLVLTPPRHHVYQDFCERVNAIYEQYSDQVERCSIDESFLDITGTLHMFGGDAIAMAHAIQQQVSIEIGVTISIGLSWNKTFAKLGSDQNKPNGLFVITRENFQQTVWPLPVGEFFGVGKNTVETLRKWGILTIGDLARADLLSLRQQFGKMGEQLHANANGNDASPVRHIGEEEQVKSVGNGITFKRDLVSESDIHTGVIALADSVASRLRAQNLKCRTVQVTIKDTQLKSIQRQKAPPHTTFLAAELSQTAIEIIESVWPKGKPIRLLALTAQNLVPADEAAEQLSLFESSERSNPKAEQLEKAMDRIRAKYGSGAVLPGAVLGNDLGIREGE